MCCDKQLLGNMTDIASLTRSPLLLCPTYLVLIQVNKVQSCGHYCFSLLLWWQLYIRQLLLARAWSRALWMYNLLNSLWRPGIEIQQSDQWCSMPQTRIPSIRPIISYFRLFFPVVAWKLHQFGKNETILVSKIPWNFVKIPFLSNIAYQIP